MTKYVRYTFRNMEPIEVADDSTAQSGQANTLCYVPGTALRGALIQALLWNGVFEENKSLIFSDRVAFLNAYPAADDHELLPSMKGFCEDKTECGNGAKKIENILLTGKTSPGWKRASLGNYCYVKDDCIFYTDVERGSDMKINTGKEARDRTVFRKQFLMPGYLFTAYIAVQDSAVMNERNKCGADGAGMVDSEVSAGAGNSDINDFSPNCLRTGTISDRFAGLLESVLEKLRQTGRFTVGGSRSFGYGLCEILSVSVGEELPYSEYMPKADLKNQAYLMLLSNTSMVNAEGEMVGLDTELLKHRLHLSELEIAACATSVVDVKGYNRTWRTAVPSVRMYEMGSVFQLSFEGHCLSAETIRQVMDEGIGVRNNEGYGRVLFFDGYERISLKKKFSLAAEAGAAEEKLNADELTTLRIAAAGYYLILMDRAQNAFLADEKNSLRRFRLGGSQLGTIASIINANLYEGEHAFHKLSEYLASAREKDSKRRILKEGRKRDEIAEYLERIYRAELSDLLPGLPRQVMGLPVRELFSPDEVARMKLKLIAAQIRCVNREGAANE